MDDLFKRPLDAAGNHFPMVAIAFITALWGLLVLFPADAFSTSAGYRALRAFASEPALGFLFFSLGAVNLHNIITENWRWVQHSSAVLMVLWLVVGLTFFISSPAAVSWVLLVGLAFLFGWSSIEAKQLRD